VYASVVAGITEPVQRIEKLSTPIPVGPGAPEPQSKSMFGSVRVAVTGHAAGIEVTAWLN